MILHKIKIPESARDVEKAANTGRRVNEELQSARDEERAVNTKILMKQFIVLFVYPFSQIFCMVDYVSCSLCASVGIC